MRDDMEPGGVPPPSPSVAESEGREEREWAWRERLEALESLRRAEERRRLEAESLLGKWREVMETVREDVRQLAAAVGGVELDPELDNEVLVDEMDEPEEQDEMERKIRRSIGLLKGVVKDRVERCEGREREVERRLRERAEERRMTGRELRQRRSRSRSGSVVSGYSSASAEVKRRPQAPPPPRISGVPPAVAGPSSRLQPPPLFVEESDDDDIVFLEEVNPSKPPAPPQQQQQSADREEGDSASGVMRPPSAPKGGTLLLKLKDIKVEAEGVRFSIPHRRHTRDVTRRATGIFYCTCGIHFTSRRKLEPHVKYWTALLKKSKTGSMTFNSSGANSTTSSTPLPSRASSVVSTVPPAEPQPGTSSAAAPGGPMFPCDLCKARFYTITQKRQHRQKKHGVSEEPGFQIGCRSCGDVFQTRKEHRRHLQTNHPVSTSNSGGRRNPVISLVDDDSSSSPNPHAPDHSKAAILGHFCQCGAPFRSKPSLDNHVRYFAQKLKRSKLTCPFKFCRIQFESPATLQQHLEVVHHQGQGRTLPSKESPRGPRRGAGKAATPYLCTCGKGFWHRQMLRKHHKTHFYRMLFQCTTCHKKFYSERKLEAHKLLKGH